MTTYSFPDIVGLDLPFNPATDRITFPSGYSAGALVIEATEDNHVLLKFGAQEVILLTTYAQLVTADFSFFTNPLGTSSGVYFGTNAANLLAGTSAGDYFDGRGGNDQIDISSGGIDKVFGGTGDNLVIAGAALTRQDQIDGGAGRDTLSLAANYTLVLDTDSWRNLEVLRLAAGFDYTIYTAATTVAAGQTLEVQGGTLGAGDVLMFDGSKAQGNFFFTPGAANDLVVGANGNDFFDLGQGGSDVARGFGGNDIFLMRGALDSGDRINGGAGVDAVYLDQVNGGAQFNITGAMFFSVEQFVLRNGSADLVFDGSVGSFGSARLSVDASALTAAQSAHVDLSLETVSASFFGGAGDDLYLGSSKPDSVDLTTGGVDEVRGGGGDDLVQFGATYTDADTYDGGQGNDVMVLRGDYSGAGTLTFANVLGTEGMQLNGGSYTLQPLDTLTGAFRYNVFAGNLTAGQTLSFDGSLETDGSYYVTGGAGDDDLTGSVGNDRIFAGAGNDVVHGGNGSDFLDGGVGNDTIFSGQGSFETLSGGDGDDILYLQSQGDVPNGGLGFDIATYELASSGVIVNAQNVEKVIGSSSDDFIAGAGAVGVLQIVGGNGADRITIGAGQSVVYVSVSDSDIGGADTLIFSGGIPANAFIDLSAIDAISGTPQNDAFDFIGSAAFSGTAGELRRGPGGSTNDNLYGDVDGDGVADFHIGLSYPTNIGYTDAQIGSHIIG